MICEVTGDVRDQYPLRLPGRFGFAAKELAGLAVLHTRLDVTGKNQLSTTGLAEHFHNPGTPEGAHLA